MNKNKFISDVLHYIATGQKLQLVKLIKDASRNPKTGVDIGLKACKDFMDNHFIANAETAELYWKFAKGKLKGRKFILIQTFSGSPKIGTIVIEDFIHYNSFSQKNDYMKHSYFPLSSHTDCWKEIIKTKKDV